MLTQGQIIKRSISSVTPNKNIIKKRQATFNRHLAFDFIIQFVHYQFEVSIQSNLV